MTRADDPRVAERVRLSQAQTRVTLRVALAFLAAAPVAVLWPADDWLALHLFLAGAVVLSVSAVSLMLTVTWSAAPAPPNNAVAVQRACVATGAAGVGLARHLRWPVAVVGIAGVLYLAGLVLLAVLLVITARRGVQRRFDPAVGSYVAAMAMGIAGVGVGVHMATAAGSQAGRAAHATLNLLGLVGLVVAGTMPFFAATVGRSRMSPLASAPRLWAALAWQVAAILVSVVGIVGGWAPVAGSGYAGYAVGVLAMMTTLPRPTRRSLAWAGPRLVALWAGGAWWAIAVLATAVGAAAGRAVLDGRWLVVLVVAGYAQVLWGSLAYLLPMLRGGGHERLGAGFAATRSWIALSAANVAGLAAALDLPTVVIGGAVAVWVLDSAWRAVRVGTHRAARPGATAVP